ncbi:hypothetical protein RhiLY_00617 [Ceratobasidium sp. AG-Ba]|nr:hypothetical protein RhiLY_00617 [Ceratobasidium sp. AG-Ba]
MRLVSISKTIQKHGGPSSEHRLKDFAATESRHMGAETTAAQPAHDLHFGKYVNTPFERLSVLILDQGGHVRYFIPTYPGDIESPSSTPASAVVPTEPCRAGEASRPFELILSDSISYLAQNSILNVNVIPPSPEEMYRSNTRCSSFPGFNRPAPCRDPAVELSNSCSNLNNFSWPQSSMLAHCEQHSLFPPSEALTQTYPGRLTLREAGIPYSSPKALAPSMPVENIPSSNDNIRQRTSMFFQRLVHKTFARSQPTKPKGPSPPQFPPQFPPKTALQRNPACLVVLALLAVAYPSPLHEQSLPLQKEIFLIHPNGLDGEWCIGSLPNQAQQPKRQCQMLASTSHLLPSDAIRPYLSWAMR